MADHGSHDSFESQSSDPLLSGGDDRTRGRGSTVASMETEREEQALGDYSDFVDEGKHRRRRLEGAEAVASYVAPLAYLGLFTGTVGSTVLRKKTSIAAAPYPFAITLMIPVVGLCIYWAIVAWLLCTGKLPAERRRVKWYLPAAIGVMFCMHNVLENLGNRGNAVPGPVVLIISKLIVPLSFFGEHIVRRLRKTYSWPHYLAVMMLMAGVAVTVGPGLTDTSSKDWKSSAAWDIILLIVSVVPLAVAFLLIEWLEKHRHPRLHPTYLWAYVCIFETLVSLPLALASAQLQGLSMSEIPHNLGDGLKCLVQGLPAGNTNVTLHNGRVVDVNCTDARLFWFGELLPGFAANLALPFCAKYGGATLLWFVRALALPVASLLFSLPALMGAHALKFTGYEVAGLGVVFVSLMLYRHRKAEEVPAGSTPRTRGGSSEGTSTGTGARRKRRGSFEAASTV